jgi:AcrR family transcriptional regulator
MKQPLTSLMQKSRGGRPSKDEAAQLEDKILDAAAELFFSEGYGEVTIEKIASTARISKRTFYVRYADKAAVFRAVVRKLVERMHLTDLETHKYFEGKNIKVILTQVGDALALATILPFSVSLMRVVMAEAQRFPELALILTAQSARHDYINRLTDLLKKQMAENQKLNIVDPKFAAEQFLTMVTAVPQRRALGLGTPMTPDELKQWVEQSVDLFIQGCGLTIS